MFVKNWPDFIAKIKRTIDIILLNLFLKSTYIMMICKQIFFSDYRFIFIYARNIVVGLFFLIELSILLINKFLWNFMLQINSFISHTKYVEWLGFTFCSILLSSAGKFELSLLLVSIGLAIVWHEFSWALIKWPILFQYIFMKLQYSTIFFFAGCIE